MYRDIASVLVIVALTSSVVLIATKHNIASLATSLTAATLVVYTLIPREEAADRYMYTRSGAIVPISNDRAPRVKKKKTRRAKPRAKPAPPPAVRAQLDPTPPPAAPVGEDAQLPVRTSAVPPLHNRDVKKFIRDNGLYGIHGNLTCQHMQRATVSDHGLLQPLNARNQMLKSMAYDQPHEKDPFLVSHNKVGQ